MSLLFVIFFCFVINASFCLQNVRIIFPETVPEGGAATLYCLYDLQGESLYSVKWYRGSHEIFTYLPKENPNIRVFLIPGLFIDVNSSNAHCLSLFNIPKQIGGNFTCEVSTEAPNYMTQYVTIVLNVVANQQLNENMNYLRNEKYAKVTLEKKNINDNNSESNSGKKCNLYHYLFLYSLLCSLFI